MNMKISLNMHGDMPFYYTGAMQARLLDAVRPDWTKGFAQSDWRLEELLAEAGGAGGQNPAARPKASIPTVAS